MSHLKLMKLLYLADREALLGLGRPITFDSYVSMDHGPVLSQTLNLLHGESQSSGPWEKSISSPENNEVALVYDPGVESLSDAEEQVVRAVFERFGKMSRWDIRDETHELPEWQDPRGSSIKIEYRDILSGSGRTQAEVESILEDLENLALLERYSR